MNIIEQLKASNSEALQQKSEDIERWSALRHTKADFELFLNFNLAEIWFQKEDGSTTTMVCTSNTTLIKMFQMVKESDKQKIFKAKSKGIKTKNLRTIDTWDLIDNKRKTVPLAAWKIIDFITISPKNIIALQELFNKLLKR